MKRTKQKPTFSIIRKELDIRLGKEISAYNNIDWSINSKKYKDNTEPRYALCLLIIQTIRKQSKTHKSDDKYVSFSSVALRKKLGVDYRKIMDICFITKRAGGGYDMKKDKITFKYKLKDIVIDICNDVYSVDKITSSHIGREGKDITSDSIPNYTITGTKQGKEIYEYKGKEHLPPFVELNDINIRIMVSVYTDLVKKYIEDTKVKVTDGEKLLRDFGWEIREHVNKDQERFHNILEERFEKIKALMDETHDTGIGVGRMVQLYKQVDSGRFYIHGDTNLQTIPKEMRKIAMGGMGYYDYDVENCHYVILKHLNKMYGGEPLKFVNRYIKDTETYRQRVSKELNISVGLAKKIMLMIIYGGGLTVRHRFNKDTYKSEDSALIKDLQLYTNNDRQIVEEIYEDIQNNKTLMGLYEDVKTARNLLLKDKDYYINYQGKDYFVNHFKRRTLLYTESGEKKNRGSRLAHILQGVESYILEVVKKEMKVVMLQHDGWVSYEDVDVKVLSSVVNKKLQYHFNKLGYKGLMEISITKEELYDIVRTPALNNRLKIPVILERG